jgi:hypothetical protein
MDREVVLETPSKAQAEVPGERGFGQILTSRYSSQQKPGYFFF